MVLYLTWDILFTFACHHGILIELCTLILENLHKWPCQGNYCELPIQFNETWHVEVASYSIVHITMKFLSPCFYGSYAPLNLKNPHKWPLSAQLLWNNSSDFMKLIYDGTRFLWKLMFRKDIIYMCILGRRHMFLSKNNS